MHDKVKAFLDAEKSAEMKKAEAKKQKTLLDLGLYEKVYNTQPAYSEEYPLFEWNEERQTAVYYKKVPVPVTDEEYTEILKYTTAASKTEKHPIANILTVIAVIVFIVGFIAGICYACIVKETSGYYSSHTEIEFNFGVAFMYWVTSFIVGVLFLALASIIQLLQDIKNK